MDAGSPAALGISPGMGAFGSVTVGATSSSTQMFTVTNSGTLQAGAAMASVTGDFAIMTNGCANKALTGGETCVIAVQFKPTATGTRSGSLMVSATPGGTVSASLTGTGQSVGALSITPDSRAFTTQVVGTTSAPFTFTVKNNGDSMVNMLAVTGSGDFVVDNKCGMTLAGQATCQVLVSFKPTDKGERTGSLTVSGSGTTTSAALSGTGAEAAKLAITPTKASFAAAIGATSSAVSFNVANVGGVATAALDTKLEGANAGEFSVVAGSTCLAALAPGGNCRVDVTFKPTGTPGPRVASLSVSSATGGTAKADLEGTAVAPGALAIQGTGTFGNVTVGSSSSSVSFEVTNTGSAPTGSLKATLGGTDSTEFSLVRNDCGGDVLAAGAKCIVAVRFSPTAAGSKSATLNVSGDPGGAAVANLTGNGIPPADLALSPSSNNFGAQALNTTGSPVSFTVTNNGGAATGALNVSITGLSASQFLKMGDTCNGTLAAAASCTVTIQFQPTTVGDKTATLSVSASPGGSVSSTLTGSGITPPSFELTPTTRAFLEAVVGYETAGQTFTIKNNSAQSSGMLAVTLGGTNAGDFQLSNNTCAMLAPGETCTVVVKFKATSTGDKNASLIVMGNGGVGSATLSGTGRAPVQLDPVAVDFDPTSVGRNSAEETITVTVRVPNAAAASLTAGESQFSITQQPTGCTGAAVDPLSPGTWQTCTMKVRFDPKEPRETKTGTVTVTAGTGNTATAALSGAAVGPLQVADLPFGDVLVGNNTQSDFTVTNNGTAPITGVTTSFSGADMVVVADACVGATIAAGGQCTISVRFSPTTTGPKSGSLTVSGLVASNTETDTASATGNGTQAGAATVALTGTAAFGSSPMTVPTTQTFTVTNSGTGATGTIGINVSGADAADFTVPSANNNCVGGLAQLPAGGSCTFQVQFKPRKLTAAGERTASLDVTLTAGAVTALTPVALTGTATQPISISPASKTFDADVVGIGGSGATQVFTVTSVATEALTLTPTIELGTGGDADVDDYTITDNQCATPVAAGGSCTVTVRFVPDSLGPSSAIIQVTDAANITASSSLAGTGVNDVDLVFVNIPGPETRSFGEVRENSGGGATLTFQVKNNGDVPTNGALTVSTLANGFTVTNASTCTGVLAAGATCNVVVQFAPGAGASGAQTSSLTVSGPKKAGGTDSTSTITLQGEAIAATSLYITPTPVSLGEVFAGESGTPVTLTVTNGGASAVTLDELRSSDAAFVIAGAGTVPCQSMSGFATVAAGASCTVSVTFSPTGAAGMRNGTVTVSTTGAEEAVAGVSGRVRSNATLTVTAPATVGADFGETVLDTTSSDRTWTITNTGERPSGALTVTKQAGNVSQFTLVSSSCDGAPVASGGTCNVVLRFAPTDPALVGGAAESVTIRVAGSNVDNAGGYIEFVATASAVLSSQISLLTTGNADLTSYDFGSKAITSETSFVVRIKNRDNSKTTSPLDIPISGGGEFDTSGCAAAKTSGLAGGDFCDLTVIFKPQTVGSSKTATLTVQATTGGTDTVTFTGAATPAITNNISTEQVFTANEEKTFTINLVAVGTPAEAKSSGALSTTLSGTDVSSFAFTENNCVGVNLTSTGTTSCTVKVRFIGTGAKTATFEVRGTGTGNVTQANLKGS